MTNRRKKIFVALSICWMILIFAFSSRDAVESTKDSYNVGMCIGRIFIKDFELKTIDEQMAFAEQIDHVVRKSAHAAEYAVLGVLLCGVFVDSEKRRKWLVAWGISAFYAGTDEIHQLFVPGRNGNLLDVCIDSMGALFGCLIVIASMEILSEKVKK